MLTYTPNISPTYVILELNNNKIGVVLYTEYTQNTPFNCLKMDGGSIHVKENTVIIKRGQYTSFIVS